jgi:metal-sulfur cluster biosynthetic enzyme
MENEGPTEDPVLKHVHARLDAILDPCCVLSGKRLSIADLGLINRVERHGNDIEVGITLTDTMCEFWYKIFADIEAIGQALPEKLNVVVVPEVLPIWSPDRLSTKAVDMIKADAGRFFRNWDLESDPRGREPAARSIHQPSCVHERGARQ